MKLALISVLLTIFLCARARANSLDTLVEVGGYKMHFVITKGKGVPILFEAGGGEDASTWNGIVKPISAITGATLITYDRAGFGKSGFDTTRHGILNGVIGLETALHKLNFNSKFVLVAHSQGGIYAKLFASRNPGKVKAVVLIDATTTCFYENKRLADTQERIDRQNTDERKVSNPGAYYQGADFSHNMEEARKIDFSRSIPIIDFVSDYPPFKDTIDIKDWKRCHREFVAASPERMGITAYGCGHFIFNDNPPLVISGIIKVYCAVMDKKDKEALLNRTLDYTIDTFNQWNKEDGSHPHK